MLEEYHFTIHVSRYEWYSVVEVAHDEIEAWEKVKIQAADMVAEYEQIALDSVINFGSTA